MKKFAPNMRRCVGLLAAALITGIASCSDKPSLTDPPDQKARAERGSSSGNSSGGRGDRSGGPRGESTDAFTFLPPLGSEASSITKLDKTLAPHLMVEVCRLAEGEATGDCQELNVELEGTKARRQDPHYAARWRTSNDELGTYRIKVILRDLSPGSIDVRLSETRIGNDTDLPTYRRGRVLPIRFRIRSGLQGAEVVGSEGGSIELPNSKGVLTIPEHAIDQEILVTVQETTTGKPSNRPSFEPVYTIALGPDGYFFNEPIELSLPLTEFPSLTPGSDNIAVVHWSADGIVSEVLTARVQQNEIRVRFRSLSKISVGSTNEPWTFTGIHWDARDLKWYWEKRAPSVYTAGEIQAALGQWAQATRGFDFVRTSNEDEANIRFYEVGVITHSNAITGSTVGAPNLCQGQQIFFSDIYGVACSPQIENVLETDDHIVVQLASKTIEEDSDDKTEAKANFVLRHEIGHALGLDHPTTMQADDPPVMQAPGLWIQPKLHAWDKAAIRQLYGAPSPETGPITDWTQEPVPTEERLLGVWASGPNDVYAVGRFGTLIHNDGSGWVQINLPTDDELSGLWGTGPNNVYAVGTAGVWHYDGSEWEQQVDRPFIFDIWGWGPNQIYAAGDRIEYFDGDTWEVQLDLSVRLTDVWGSSPSNVFAVGHNGTILHYDGSSWSEQSSGVGTVLFSVWGSGPENVYAAGLNGVILHYDGQDWSRVQAGLPGFTYDEIWGTGPNNVYLVAFSEVIHFDGQEWSRIEVPILDGEGMWGLGPDEAWIVGAGGVIHGTK